MEMKKLVPIILAIALLVIAGFLLSRNLKMNKTTYSKMVASYNNQNEEHTNLKVDDVIVINNVSFWVVAVEPNKVVLQSSVSLKDDSEKEVTEFEVKTSGDTKACFSDDSCVLFKLA